MWSGNGAEIVPAHLTDRLALAVVLMYAGTGPEARTALAPVLALVPQGGDSPIPWRLAPWQVSRFAMWADPANDHPATTWARRLSSDLEPWASGHVYLNWTADQGADRLLARLGADSLTRLAAVTAH